MAALSAAPGESLARCFNTALSRTALAAGSIGIRNTFAELTAPRPTDENDKNPTALAGIRLRAIRIRSPVFGIIPSDVFMRKCDLKVLLMAAIKRQELFARSFDGSSNPKTREMYIDSEASAHALKAVLEAVDAPRPSAAISLISLAG